MGSAPSSPLLLSLRKVEMAKLRNFAEWTEGKLHGWADTRECHRPSPATERKEGGKEEWAEEQSGKMGLNVDFQAKKMAQLVHRDGHDQVIDQRKSSENTLFSISASVHNRPIQSNNQFKCNFEQYAHALCTGKIA